MLIINDVVTTGATLRAADKALKRYGAVEVSALTLATAKEGLLLAPRAWK